MILNISSLDTEHPEMFCKKMLWKILQDSQKNNWVGVSFLITQQACTFIKNDIATQVFYEIFENAFFIKKPTGDCFCITLMKTDAKKVEKM